MVITDIIAEAASVITSIGADLIVAEIVRKNIPKHVNKLLKGTILISGIVAGAFVGDQLGAYAKKQITDISETLKGIESMVTPKKEDIQNGNAEIQS